MKITVKQLLAQEQAIHQAVVKLTEDMIAFDKCDVQAAHAITSLDIIGEDGGKSTINGYIHKPHVIMEGLDPKGRKVSTTIHIPYRGPFVVTMDAEELDSGVIDPEQMVKVVKTLIRELSMSMSSYWLDKTGDLKRAMELLEEDDTRGIYDLFDGMIDIHYNDTGWSIALLASNGAPIATEAGFDRDGVYGYGGNNAASNKEYIRGRLPHFIRYGCAYSGHYEIWKAPFTKED